MRVTTGLFSIFVLGFLLVSGGNAPAGKVDKAPYRASVDQLVRDNDAYRRVLFTGSKSQLVAMSIPAGGDIGEETHERVEQTIVCVSGDGQLELNGIGGRFQPGDIVVITPGTRHNIRNTGGEPLKLYTIYVPPNHIDKRIHMTKTNAQADRADAEFGRRVE
jgi:mannose-6-phosphate isomerase-like protein (cupin superfamily)